MRGAVKIARSLLGIGAGHAVDPRAILGPARACARGGKNRPSALAKEQEAKLWELRAAMSLARLRRQQDRRSEAGDLLAPVYDWFTEGFDTPDLKEAKTLLNNKAAERLR